MPLRAIINGEDVIAPFLEEGAWEALKNRVKFEKLCVHLPCCDSPAYLRTSKHGFHHFVHKTQENCTSRPETWQHLKAKYEIALACQAVGYDAKTEVSGNEWRADVLAVKGDIRVAFEVQWSSQTLEITQDRQHKLTEAGVRGCWFFKSPPPHYQANRDLPLFKLDVTDDSCMVIFNSYGYEFWHENRNQAIPLTQFVEVLLSYQIKFCNILRSKSQQKIRIVFTEITCWKCHRPYHVYYMHDLKTACGDTVDVSGASWGNDKYYFSPQILTLVNEFIRSPEGRHIRLGSIKKRYSKTVGQAYMSFGCPHCDAICGDFFLHHEIIPEVIYYEDQAPAILEKEITLNDLAEITHPHWCFPENKEFCCR